MNDVTDTEESGPLSIADIAGISMDTIEAVRFEDLPAMRAAFELTSFDLVELGDANKPAAKMNLRVVGVESFNDDGPDSEVRKDKMLNKSHNETIFLDVLDLATSIGRVKAFLEDAGFTCTPGESFLTIGKTAAASQMPFMADVKKRKRKDTENEYWTNVYPVANLNKADDTVSEEA